MILAAALLLAAAPGDAALAARVDKVLARTPIVDGHNDLPWELRANHGRRVEAVDLRAGTDRLAAPLQTDIARLRRGHVGAQFWSVWIPATLSGDEAIRTTLEEIDIVHRLVARWPDTFEFARTAADVRRIEQAGRIASLIGVEGGAQIGGSLATLRLYRRLGVAYMTLTHSKTTDWADSATDAPRHDGLSPFGVAVVREMNRIGMIVDLSHVSEATMLDALAATKAPVIFSHSGARGVNDHPRNVPDSVLAKLPANGGVVMVNVYPAFVSRAYRDWSAARSGEEARLKALYPGDAAAAAAALATWDNAHAVPRVTPADLADHVEHIARVAGRDHVGIGGDYDGIDGTGPEGMRGVDGYPLLFVELARRGWSDADLAKLSGGNVLRVMARAEAVAAAMKDVPPAMEDVTPTQ
ncbi:dipeptidase [Sphingomonas jatrophae]|uniref:Membrane dipeptidase n=1 Tax=Sphingomonas jatrophae TaxID=1166337 RepID=A0A1I6LBW2_9SPHN|nr:dipeptidase [Sphingomonas jatrophae]SFS00897.1 membrane dipeptidase [Sphingomonas jatrophae]